MNTLAILGLSLSLAALILAALADPEPASKLALIGLSAASITALMPLIKGEDDSSPQSQESA